MRWGQRNGVEGGKTTGDGRRECKQRCRFGGRLYYNRKEVNKHQEMEGVCIRQ